jgi:hypothetical protein
VEEKRGEKEEKNVEKWDVSEGGKEAVNKET